MRKADALPWTPDDRSQLEAWSKGRTIPARLVERARILLLLADGSGIRPAAKHLQVGLNTVLRRRNRFLDLGCQGILHDAPGRGRKPSITVEHRAEIVRMATQEKPYHATPGSSSRMAVVSGVSTFTVATTWKANGLKPHRVRTFKLSNDPHFSGKVEDIVGLYLNPPEHAVVLSVDEKTQIQVLDHTQPGLPVIGPAATAGLVGKWLTSPLMTTPGRLMWKSFRMRRRPPRQLFSSGRFPISKARASRFGNCSRTTGEPTDRSHSLGWPGRNLG